MGQYLMIGLKQGLKVEKNAIRKYVRENRTEESILSQMEQTLRLEKFIKTTYEDCYIYELDKDILNRELITFLKRFYELRYVGKCKFESDFAISRLESLSNFEERMDFLESNSCQSFQVDKRYETFYLDDDSFFRIPFTCREIVLSMDGKIIMECYNEVLDFFRRCIVTQFDDLELASALDVYISN